MRFQAILAALYFSLASSLVVAQQAAESKPAAAEDAKAFVDRANADLLKLNTESAHAEWTVQTYITEDTEATTALLSGQFNARNLELIAESHRFDHLDLPPDIRRQIKLLQVGAPATPREPKLLEEQSELAAQLTGMYGKGKYCPGTDEGKTPGARCEVSRKRRNRSPYGQITQP